jgi:signal transduction histidine kinase
MTGTGHDVTERKQAEEERATLLVEQAARRDAEEANRAKDHFVAMLSHELRTPLNAALGWTQMLRECPPDDPRATRAVDAVYRNLLLQARLVSDVLDISRATRGALRLDRAPADLAEIVAAARDLLQEPAAARHVVFEVDMQAGVPVMGDAKRLQQVMWNLLSNAIKFGREGGLVRIRAANRGDTAEIVVEDDGPGIDPAFLPHVFEPFRQADASPRRAHDGLGLGLAIAKHLVELHGGTMAAANGPRGGALLTVILPAHTTISAA